MHRAPPSSLRQPSMSGSGSQQSAALLARVNEKKIELNNLIELSELSAQLANQMQMLEDKLSTLSNGTEGLCFALRAAEGRIV